MAAEAVFLDTNVLLAAATPTRSRHADAVRLLDARSCRHCVSGQVLREFLVVSTRPVAVNGLGLNIDSALRNVQVMLRRCQLLPEDERTAAHLLDLVRVVSCTGKQIHDANIVAMMLSNGVRTLATGNPSHFDRYRDLIEIRAL